MLFRALYDNVVCRGKCPTSHCVVTGLLYFFLIEFGHEKIINENKDK